MRNASKSIGELQAQLAEERSKNDALTLVNESLSVCKRRKKISVDPNTQFSNVEAIKRAQAEARVASAAEAENRAQPDNTVAGRAEKIVTHELNCSFVECLFQFKAQHSFME
ncbi:hypothetical protein K3495_g7169 [Podosphaera aphanis]|nr:hypothetical protein K3495_g7169 [Podosphaera aphanis]